jgi:hypothetical protein
LREGNASDTRAIAIAVPPKTHLNLQRVPNAPRKTPKIAANAAAVFPEHRHAQ